MGPGQDGQHLEESSSAQITALHPNKALMTVPARMLLITLGGTVSAKMGAV